MGGGALLLWCDQIQQANLTFTDNCMCTFTTCSDHEAAGSVLSGDRSFDEPAWGTFDANDDVDSVWGFNPVSSSKVRFFLYHLVYAYMFQRLVT